MMHLISTNFLNALQDLANQESWWRDVLIHQDAKKHFDLFIAVRKNYLNVYYQGAAIYKIEYKNGEVIPSTHIKYLTPSLQKYIALRNNQFELGTSGLISQYSGMTTLNNMLAAARPYVGLEKKGLHPMLIGNANVLDVELSLARANSNNDIDILEDVETTSDNNDEDVLTAATLAGSNTNRQDRLDVVLAEFNSDKQPVIRFVEAKHYANPELREKKGKISVVEQMQRYEKTIEMHHDDLAQRYQETARIKLQIEKMRHALLGGTGELNFDRAVEAIAVSQDLPLIDSAPSLLVFGYDLAQRNYDKENNTLAKLKRTEITSRVQAIGAPKFTTKFST